MDKFVISMKNAEMKKVSFPPLIDEDSEILVLGTMPGDDSLRLNQYYASSNNSFWKIVNALFNENKGFADYKEKVACLKKNHIALWDVFSSCEREGSSDSNIRKGELNDIDGLLKRYSNIKKIVFNGQKSAKYYKPHIAYAIAQSTSNLNTRATISMKIEDWETKLKK